MINGRLLLLLFLLAGVPLRAADNTKHPVRDKAPDLDAKGVLLVDVTTGTTLYEKNADTLYRPASIVKMFTGLLALENLKLDDVVEIAKADTMVEPSSVPLRVGEKVSVGDLVHSIIIGSDNDSAMALARAVSGSQAEFAKLMNQRAAELGCTKSKFTNPHGLPDDKQLVTAREMMLIFNKFLSKPMLKSIAQKKSFVLSTEAKTQTVTNHNKLLGKLDGMGPAKTGWTVASRHTYAASITRDGRELRLILLNSKNKWTDTRALVEWAFANLPEIEEENEEEVPPNNKEPTSSVIAQTTDQKVEKRSSPPVLSRKLTVHTVSKGETLYSIGRKYGCKVEDILFFNALADPNRLSEGQVIYIPAKN